MLNNPVLNPSIGSITSSGGGINIVNIFLVNFINLAFGVGGIILFFMLLWGGFEFLTSGGDKDGTEKAKKRMTTALIGMAILLSVYATIAVLEIFFGINIRSFAVPTVNGTPAIPAPSGPVQPQPTVQPI